MILQFLKNILANDFAITQLTPEPIIDSGACSRDEPQPKLIPPTIISPSFTLLANVVSISSMQCFANSFGSVDDKYLAGMITSVST